MKLTKLSLGLLLSLIPLCVALVIRVLSLSPEENPPTVISSDSLMSMPNKSEVIQPIQAEKTLEEKHTVRNTSKTAPATSPKLEQSTPTENEVEKLPSSPGADSQVTQVAENTILAPEEVETQNIDEPEVLTGKESPAQSTGFNTGVYNQEQATKKEAETKKGSRTEFRALIQGKKVQQGSLIQVVLQEDISQYSLEAGTYLQAECEFRNQRLQLSITQAKINGRFKRIKLIGYDAKDGIMGITHPEKVEGVSSEWIIPNGYPLHLRFD